MEIFKKRLIALLENIDISQRELAKRVGVQEATISRYVNGERKPTSEILSKIADALNVSSDYLLGRTDKENIELINEGLPQELINAGIEAIEVFKGVKLVDLNPDDIKKLVDFANEIKNRP